MKKNIFIIFAVLMLLLSGCSNSGEKTVKTREEVKEMVEEFYKDLSNENPITMKSYFNDELLTEYIKDQDKMYVKQEEAAYDFYMFIEDGVKYLIADDRTLFEDESMYDMYSDTINMTLDMNVKGFLDVEDESVSFSATNKNDKELTLLVSAKDEQGTYEVNTVGKKNDDGKIVEILSTTTSGDQTYNMKYEFSYEDNIVLPEYTKPISYNDMPHVESSYKTFGEIINKYDEENSPMFLFSDNELIMIDSLDGRHYQYSSVVSQDILDAYESIDFMADDSNKQVNNLLSDIEIEDCIDFSDVILSQDVLASYEGKTIGELVEEGFEINGYGISEEASNISLSKDLLTYGAEVTPNEGFDTSAEFEYEDLYGFIIKSVEFEVPDYAALPMR